ncbi:MAG: DUF302 domain-containing protein [Salinivirgaceae bacterium]
MKKFKFLLGLIMVLSIQPLLAQEQDKQYFSTTVHGSFEEIVEKVTDNLFEQGFGIVTEIDLADRIKDKLGDVSMKPYKILGPCIAKYAYEAYKVEENIGFILPCRVIIKDLGNNKVEVMMENPTKLMLVKENPELMKITTDVKLKYLAVLDAL